MQPYFRYRIPWRPHSQQHGSYTGNRTGEGLELHSFSSHWHTGASARHIDLRASLLDPYGHWVVKQYRPPAGCDIHIMLDTSASMLLSPDGSDLHRLSSLLECIIYSTFLAGDRCALWTAARQKTDAIPLLSPAIRQGLPQAVIQHLQMDQSFEETGSEGLLDIAKALPARRALIFLLSDFYWPEALLKQLLPQLARHDTVCLRTRDNHTWLSQLPAWRILTLYDPETRRRSPILSRPSLTQKWLQHEDQWTAWLRRYLAQHGCAMIAMTGQLDPQPITRHFYPD